ncbi:MAG TPA: hypothetical protein VGZ69_04280 [Candidatus Rhabdochlamydia sp.]|jgi:hypothetical protein|nr:hypothetical protein [Candidatus Rhabdochlamydia sp.]
MKKAICALLSVTLISSPLYADKCLNVYQQQIDETWETGAAVEDSNFTAISTSMIGWGICLAIGIVVLACVIHQSKK